MEMKFFWEVLFPLIIVVSVWAGGIVYVCLKPSLWPKLFKQIPSLHIGPGMPELDHYPASFIDLPEPPELPVDIGGPE